MVRIVYLAVYAALAALGEALVAKPALLWLRSQGVLRAALPWEVPFGALALLLAALLAALTLALAAQAALGARPRVPQHALFLCVLGACFALRFAAGEPRPPPDPAPRLYQGLRAAAEQLDQAFAGTYAPMPLQLGDSPFRRFGRTPPLRARFLDDADGPQRTPLAGDAPGTIYVAIGRDRTAAWLTALSIGGVLKNAIESHAGTHSLPGRDALVPAYPGMRSATERR